MPLTRRVLSSAADAGIKGRVAVFIALSSCRDFSQTIRPSAQTLPESPPAPGSCHAGSSLQSCRQWSGVHLVSPPQRRQSAKVWAFAQPVVAGLTGNCWRLADRAGSKTLHEAAQRRHVAGKRLVSCPRPCGPPWAAPPVPGRHARRRRLGHRPSTAQCLPPRGRASPRCP